MNEQCPHLDYGKSTDKCMGAYCLLKKMLVEDCEACEDSLRLSDAAHRYLFEHIYEKGFTYPQGKRRL